MKSVLFHLGPITVYSYGTILALAFVLGLIVLVHRGSSVGVSRQTIYDMGIWVILGGLLGARVAYVAFHWGEFSGRPLEIFMIHRGGLAFYGSFMGGLIALWIFLKRRNLSFLKMADLMIPAVVLAHSVGRIGCFMNGCCYGRPTTCLFGVSFPVASLPVRRYGIGPLVHPAQLYEAVSLLILFVLLLWVDRRKNCDGQTFIFYLILYPCIRFFIEFFRGDNPFVGVLTIYQVVSLVFLAVALIFYYRLRREAAKRPRGV